MGQWKDPTLISAKIKMYYAVIISVCIHEVFYNPWRFTPSFPQQTELHKLRLPGNSEQYFINSMQLGSNIAVT